MLIFSRVFSRNFAWTGKLINSALTKKLTSLISSKSFSPVLLENFIKAEKKVQTFDLMNMIKALNPEKLLVTMPVLSSHLIENLNDLTSEDFSKLIFSLKDSGITIEELWDAIVEKYFEKVFSKKHDKKALCVQTLFQNSKKTTDHQESIKNYVKNENIFHKEFGIFASLARFLDDSEVTAHVLDEFEKKFELIHDVKFIIPAQHLSKLGKLNEAILKKIAERITKMEILLEPDQITRCVNIFTDEYTNFPFLIQTFHRMISKSISKFSQRELINLLHPHIVNDFYFDLPTVELIYNELLTRKNILFNPVDFSSLMHCMKKFDLDAKPFLKYCTEEMLNQCTGNQIAIIFHSVFAIVEIETYRLLQDHILLKISEMTSKHIVNVSRDLSDNKEIDTKYLRKFKTLSAKYMDISKNPDLQQFYTQHIASTVKTSQILK